MSAAQSGIVDRPATDRQRRLALQLADMIPGAAIILVNLHDPHMAWPSPHATVKDAAGQLVRISRTTATIAARWVLRAHPDADWTEAHRFDLATATLTPAAQVASGRGR